MRRRKTRRRKRQRSEEEEDEEEEEEEEEEEKEEGKGENDIYLPRAERSARQQVPADQGRKKKMLTTWRKTRGVRKKKREREKCLGFFQKKSGFSPGDPLQVVVR